MSENEMRRIKDNDNSKMYIKERFLGKGGFAECYVFTAVPSNLKFAGKEFSKQKLTPNSQERIQQEIIIHGSLCHQNIVQFVSSFEDSKHIYIMLELCACKTLLELSRRRVLISTTECRYYTKQILEACIYIHKECVIHRDIKLGNIFLTDKMVAKLGDFGLAVRVKDGMERRMTLCGTPNYISPEVLKRVGHSFKVDVWAVGVVIFTLLAGHSPFEMPTLKDTYKNIRHGYYAIPDCFSTSSARIIKRIFTIDPDIRPSVEEVLNDEWLSNHYVPDKLPDSALSVKPNFINHKPVRNKDKLIVSMSKETCSNCVTLQTAIASILTELFQFLFKTSSLSLLKHSMQMSEHPASAPVFWVSKWIDYSSKYGLGYMMCDDSSGIRFIDKSSIIWASNKQNFQYVSPNGEEKMFPVSKIPGEFEMKVKLLFEFINYMNQNLLGTSHEPRREYDPMIRLPYLLGWVRKEAAILMIFSNGSMQVNFFNDHAKLIICPTMSAVTYIDSKRRFHTFKFDLLCLHGVQEDLRNRLVLIYDLMKKPNVEAEFV